MIKLVSLEAVERERERELHFKKKCNIVQQSDTSNLINKRINIEEKAMCFSDC